MCAQGKKELVIRSPLLLAQLADLLCGSFTYEGACRHRKMLPAIRAPFAFFVGREGSAYIAGIHLGKASRQIRPVQQRLVLQPIPQIVTEVPVLACRPQVVQEAQDSMQTLRVQEQEWATSSTSSTRANRSPTAVSSGSMVEVAVLPIMHQKSEAFQAPV